MCGPLNKFFSSMMKQKMKTILALYLISVIVMYIIFLSVSHQLLKTTTATPNQPIPPPRPAHPRPEVAALANLSVALVIMEGLLRPGIDGAVTSVISNTPFTWSLYFIHAPKDRNPSHYDEVKNMTFNRIINEQQRPICFIEMPQKYYGQSQNVPCSDPDFWNMFEEDWIFLFHADSSMCSHPTIHLRDFFQYSYVGAPWRQFPDSENRGDGAAYRGGKVYVGNGGFSLRRREWMLFCLKNFPFQPPEDAFFAYCTENSPEGRPIKLDNATKFAVEGISTPGGALGVHGICMNAGAYPHGCNKSWIDEWLKTCPESAFMFSNGGRCPNCR